MDPERLDRYEVATLAFRYWWTVAALAVAIIAWLLWSVAGSTSF
jgi:hypothetical protein